MHVDWAVFAAKMDSNPDGTVNVYSMGTPTATFRRMPARIPALTFFVMCMFADSDQGASYRLQVTLIGPGGKAMLTQEVRVQREAGPGKLLPFTFTNIDVPQVGTYRARFEAGGQRREWPFHVALMAEGTSNQAGLHVRTDTVPDAQS